MRIVFAFLASTLFWGCRTAESPSGRAISLVSSVSEASKADALAEGDEVTVSASVEGTQNYFLDAHKFVVASDGRTLVSSVPVFYPDPKQAVTFYAYTGMQSVPSDQSTPAELKKADLCWATASSTPSNTAVPLQFSHVFARLVVTCSAPTSKITVVNAFSGGSLDVRTGSFANATKSDVFTTGNELILPAQTLSRLIVASNGVDYVFDGPISLESGKTTTVNLTLNTTTHTASLAGSNISAWNLQSAIGAPSQGISNTLTLQWVPGHSEGIKVNKVVLTIKDGVLGTTTDYTVSAGILYANNAATFPFVQAALHYPYTLVAAKLYIDTYLLHSSVGTIGATVYKSGAFSIGVKGALPLNPPSPSQYMTISGLKWCIGNLVATSLSNNYECKVGQPTDGGLYFQFGSLIGWKGGATGTGEGRNPFFDQGWGGSAWSWSKDIMVWPTVLYGTGVSTWPFGITSLQWYFGLPQYRGYHIIEYPGFSAGNFAAQGVGDPCTYYLGVPWRTPTRDDFIALIGQTYVVAEQSVTFSPTNTPKACVGTLNGYLGMWAGTTAVWSTPSQSNAVFIPASGWKGERPSAGVDPVGVYKHGGNMYIATCDTGGANTVDSTFCPGARLDAGDLSYIRTAGQYNRYTARPVRCVAN